MQKGLLDGFHKLNAIAAYAKTRGTQGHRAP
jgi:hypothetical protein